MGFNLLRISRRIFTIASLLICLAMFVAAIAADSAPVATSEMPSVRGVAVPEVYAIVKAPLTGTVRKASVEVGAVVRAGDTLAHLDNEEQAILTQWAKNRADSREGIRQAEAMVESAKHRLKASGNPVDKAGVSDVERRLRTFELYLAESELDRATERRAQLIALWKIEEEHLCQYTLRSPIDGIVIRIMRPGQETRVREGDEILAIAGISRLTVALELPLSMYDKVKKGGTCRLLAGAPVNKEVAGTIVHVPRIVDGEKGTFRVEITIDNPDLKMPAGFQVSLVSIPLDDTGDKR